MRCQTPHNVILMEGVKQHNPTTTFSFDISKRGNASLNVDDMLGKAVATLGNDELNAGHHFVNFNA